MPDDTGTTHMMPGVRTSDLDYDLPERLIAQHPASQRPMSKLMVVDASGPVSVDSFPDTLLAQLRDDDLVVVNDSRVLHARIHVTRSGGGRGELLLLEPVSADRGERVWTALARPGRRLRSGAELTSAGGDPVRCVEPVGGGAWAVEIPVPASEAPAWLEVHGSLPLPPYIRANGQPPERYQTVYAREHGSVAAPTAGLHFDDALWREIAGRVEVAHVTLHVGVGTFQPVRTDSLDGHAMHSERYSVDPESDSSIRAALAHRRRIIAVGTTTTRVLESVYGETAMPTWGRTDLFITPGYRFGCVGALLTNFHLPRSTLLALVMAFAGVEATRRAYCSAIEQDLRFYSFGDAMFVTR